MQRVVTFWMSSVTSAMLLLASCHGGTGNVESNRDASGPAASAPDAEAIAAAALRIHLGPEIEGFLAKPEVHAVAYDRPVDYSGRWGNDVPLVTCYVQDYAFDVPLTLIRLPGSPRFFVSSPRFVFENDWGIVVVPAEDIIAPSLRDIGAVLQEAVPAASEERIRELSADLTRRLTLENDHAYYQRLYALSFDNVDLEGMSANDLVETWTLLRVKFVTALIGTETRIAFGRTPHFSAITTGTLDVGRGLFVKLSDGLTGLHIYLTRDWRVEPPAGPMDQRDVNHIFASVRRHGSMTPGADQRDAAQRVLNSSNSEKGKAIACSQLVAALQYADGLAETRRMLRSLLKPDTEHRDHFVDLLERSEKGLCLRCGKRNDNTHPEKLCEFLEPIKDAPEPDRGSE